MTTPAMSGMTGASADAIELLTRQHREVDQIWSQLQASHAHGSQVQHHEARSIVKLLSQHDAIETQLLYPELRERAGAPGKEIAEQSLTEHQKVRDLLKDVDGADISDEEVFATMAECIAVVRRHVEEEESEVFPLLREHVDQPRLQELGEEMTAMLDMAPTHPHPMTPDSKVGATIAGAAAGLADKVRDAIRGDRDHRRGGPLAR